MAARGSTLPDGSTSTHGAGADRCSCASKTPPRPGNVMARHVAKPGLKFSAKQPEVFAKSLLRAGPDLPSYAPQQRWPVRLSVRTPGFQPGKRGSIPLRAATYPCKITDLRDKISAPPVYPSIAWVRAGTKHPASLAERSRRREQLSGRFTAVTLKGAQVVSLRLRHHRNVAEAAVTDGYWRSSACT